ncbi:hypothetical protein KAI04_03365 [Candidatus Pacearchaeota archaeon]|nr:hypothetical protein [Candidatus Pacearchaeota archaeon]
MPISALKLLELNEKYNLIENLSERELLNPEGVGTDLRVGEVYKIIEPGFLGIDERHTPAIKKVADINEGDKKVVLNPGAYVLVKTMERLNVPAEKISLETWKASRYLMPVVYPRSTLQRCGIALFRTKTDPGYSGELTFGLTNLGNQKFTFELGARMFNVVFEPVIGDINRAYSGQHNQGRVSGGVTEFQN